VTLFGPSAFFLTLLEILFSVNPPAECGQSEGFYLILTGALMASLALAVAGISPIQLIFYANVLVGVLAPILVIFILLVGNNQKIMQGKCLSLLTNVFLVFTAVLMIAAAALFFYSLLSGRGS
jgi:Mn2+/Fe2+ NRAMP family transporter